MPWNEFDPYSTPLHKPSSTSPHNVPQSSAWMSRKENKADLPKNFGFRGRHNHGKAADDPVYPTRPIPPSLRPKTLMDWRSGGRIMLAVGMAMLERRARLRSKAAIYDYSLKGFCSPRCGFTCAIEKRRILCGWFVPGTVHEHVNNMDGIIRKFKGTVKLPRNKVISTVMNQVAEPNATPAVAVDIIDGKFASTTAHSAHVNRGGYNADDDPEALDSDDEIPNDAASVAEAYLYLNNHHL